MSVRNPFASSTTEVIAEFDVSLKVTVPEMPEWLNSLNIYVLLLNSFLHEPNIQRIIISKATFCMA